MWLGLLISFDSYIFQQAVTFSFDIIWFSVDNDCHHKKGGECECMNTQGCFNKQALLQD